MSSAPFDPSKTATAPKLRKGEFRCFRCRSLFVLKDGDWYDWESMQVHLCRPCEKATQNSPERAHSRAQK